MYRETIVFLAGFLLVLLPYIGIPSTWKEITTVVIGALFVIVGYSLRRSAFLRSIEDEYGERTTESFTEQRSSQLSAIEESEITR
jgi:hypothetical protein